MDHPTTIGPTPSDDDRAAMHAPNRSRSEERPQNGSGAIEPYRVPPMMPPAGRVPPPPPPAVSALPDAFNLLKALQKRWALALVLGLVCGAVAAGVAWLVVPASQYSARARLRAHSTYPYNVSPMDQRTDYRGWQQTQLALIRSGPVLNVALRDATVSQLEHIRAQADPIDWLETKISASWAGEILTISMSDETPNHLVPLVNAITDAYLSEVVNVEAEDRRRRYDRLRELYREYQDKLQDRRRVLESLAEQLGSSDRRTVRYAHEIKLEQLAMMEQELQRLKTDLRNAEIRYQVLEQSRGTQTDPKRMALDSVIERLINDDSRVQSLRGQIDDLDQEIRMQERRSKYNSDPAIRHLKERRQAIARTLEQRRAQLRAWYAEHPPDLGPTGQNSSLVALAEEIEILKQLVDLTQTEVDSLFEATTGINRNTLELEKLQDEIAHVDDMTKRIGNLMESLSVELDAPPRVEFLERAEAPRMEPDKRPKIAGMAGLGTFAFVLLGISLLEFRARRIGSVDEVVHGLGIRLMGALPAMPNRGSTSLLRHREPNWQNLLIESVDSVRTMLLHAAFTGTDPLHVVMVTSAVAGEGKTSLSCHLATSLARAGRRTLLVDCDLRNPAAHLLFDLPCDTGFCELLRNEATLDEVIQPTPANGLWMIAAGDCDHQAIQALALPQVGLIFEQLREQFDFIVVDTAPVLPVADSLLVGQHVDAAICSILCDVSRAPKVHAANERLLTLGIRILGAVMTGVRSEVYGYSYPNYVRS